MDSDRVDIPISFWERLVSDKRRLALVGGGAFVLIAALAWALLAGPLSRGGSDWDGGGPAALDPIDAATETSSTSESGQSESSSRTLDAAPDSDDSANANAGAKEPEFARAALIAYRKDGVLWVAAEDGSAAQRVASSAAGAFALSPDGAVLAWVDPQAHVLHLTTVAVAGDKVVGPAEDVRPFWAPDSTRVAYTGVESAHLQVHAVGADGSGDRMLGDGNSPAISADGRIAFIASGAPGAMGPIMVTDARQNAAQLSVSANAVTFGGDGLVWASSGSDVGSERIMTSGVDGSDQRELIGSTSLNRPAAYAMLCMSPDGDSLLYGASGDDGFSRAFVTSIAKPAPVALTVRRDTYPQAWSANGGHVFLFEGNVFQGETSALLRTDTSGFGRVVVVQGAGF